MSQRGGGGGGGGRGGGGGGRGRGRGRGRRDQQPPPVTSSSGRTGGRGRGGSGPPPARQQQPVGTHSPSPSTSRYPPSPAQQLSREVEQRLTLQPVPQPVQPPPSQVPSSSSAPAQLSQSVLAPAEHAQISTPPPSSSKSDRPPARPGYGTVGRKCIVRANHFLVDLSNKDLHHYDVTIKPEVTSKKVCREIINELVNSYLESHLGRRTPAYDGSKSLYTAGPFPFSSTEFVVRLPDRDGEARREREFRVAIKFAAKVDLYHLEQFLQGRQFEAPQETVQALDVVLGSMPSNRYTVVGRSFFSPQLGPKGSLGDGVQYWSGFYKSLRPAQMGLSLNIDVSARSFYEPIMVSAFVAQYLNVRQLTRPLSDQDRIKVKKALKGITVQTTYGENSRRYKVKGLSVQPTSQVMFPSDNAGARISVFQYFQERYNIALNLPFLPALQAGNDARPAYLPMELCKIADGQRYTKKLNERQVTALLRATCQRPPDRERSIKQMGGYVHSNGNNELLNEFGLQVRDALTSVDARVLPPPVLLYQGTQETPRVGAWNMIDKKMVNGGRVEFWTCVNFSRLRQDDVYRFCEDLVNMCRSKGMDFNTEPLIPIRSSPPAQIERALNDIHTQSGSQLARIGQSGKQLQLLIIVLPDFSGSYGRIKRLCETEFGIVSQCCQPKQLMKHNNKQYLENVSLKINVKAGGRNTVLSSFLNNRIPFVNDMPTIIFGADVTHPQPGDDSCPSIAAVVASMDWPHITKYRGLVSAQHHREEIIQDLYKCSENPQKGRVHSGMVRDLLIAFRRSTGHKPSRIIFYRDGVSEGQFSQVLLYEMDAIRKACLSLEENYLPRVTFVVVQKRHHTRLFPAVHGDRNSTDRSGNILPGTVVDTQICHPTEFDFFLCSHAGIQGTSRPTHYHVLFDENSFTADALQTLTNNLCYTYARCTRSVSIVPPAYYAHLAAFRARYYIEGEISESESTSGGGGQQTRERNVAVRPLPVIKDNVKDVMFYC